MLWDLLRFLILLSKKIILILGNQPANACLYFFNIKLEGSNFQLFNTKYLTLEVFETLHGPSSYSMTNMTLSECLFTELLTSYIRHTWSVYCQWCIHTTAVKMTEMVMYAINPCNVQGNYTFIAQICNSRQISLNRCLNTHYDEKHYKIMNEPYIVTQWIVQQHRVIQMEHMSRC